MRNAMKIAMPFAMPRAMLLAIVLAHFLGDGLSRSFLTSMSIVLAFSWRRSALQPLAQIEHRIPFARQQRVHVHAGVGSDLLEAASLDLVCHKYLDVALPAAPRARARTPRTGRGAHTVPPVPHLQPAAGLPSAHVSPSSVTIAVSLNRSGCFLRNRSVMRFCATRTSQPAT